MTLQNLPQRQFSSQPRCLYHAQKAKDIWHQDITYEFNLEHAVGYQHFESVVNNILANGNRINSVLWIPDFGRTFRFNQTYEAYLFGNYIDDSSKMVKGRLFLDRTILKQPSFEVIKTMGLSHPSCCPNSHTVIGYHDSENHFYQWLHKYEKLPFTPSLPELKNIPSIKKGHFTNPLNISLRQEKLEALFLKEIFITSSAIFIPWQDIHGQVRGWEFIQSIKNFNRQERFIASTAPDLILKPLDNEPSKLIACNYMMPEIIQSLKKGSQIIAQSLLSDSARNL